MKPKQKNTMMKDVKSHLKAALGEGRVPAFGEWLIEFMKVNRINKSILKEADQRRVGSFTAGYIKGYGQKGDDVKNENRRAKVRESEGHEESGSVGGEGT